MTMTLQILVEGKYGGILKKDERLLLPEGRFFKLFRVDTIIKGFG